MQRRLHPYPCGPLGARPDECSERRSSRDHQNCAGAGNRTVIFNFDLTSRALARNGETPEPRMTFDRRSILGAGLGLGAAATAARAGDKDARAANAVDLSPTLTPDDGRDQTSALQAAIDAAAEKDIPLSLPPGT